MDSGFDWFLIVIVAVVSVLVFFVNAYLIVYLQHPEDRNQAWLPKGVVWLGLNLATLSVLMFPLDVANEGACDADVPLSSCHLTIPMRSLWFAVYLADAILVFFLTPFALFYYEAGSEKTPSQRLCVATAWVTATGIVFGLTLGIAYGLAGYVEYPTTKLTSGSMNVQTFWNLNNIDHCLSVDSTASSLVFDGQKCDADGDVETQGWKLRTSFALYVVALCSAIGWMTFLIFGGVGLSSLPADLIAAFFTRPTATITRSEYIHQAKFLAQHAREVKTLGEELKTEERESGKGRRWRGNFKELNRQLMILEEMHQELESKYPQVQPATLASVVGEDGETRWVLFQLSFILKLLTGCIGAGISIVWIVHVVLYLLISPPASPFLNEVFVELDEVFPLFGTASFAFFCFYLLACTIKGHMKLGMSFGILDLYPIRYGATLMNSLLFNTALILLSSTAVLQFCSEAFAVYAQDTAIQEIFGNDVDHLVGIKHLYKENIFLYCLLGSTTMGIVLLIIRGPRGYNKLPREEPYTA